MMDELRTVAVKFLVGLVTLVALGIYAYSMGHKAGEDKIRATWDAERAQLKTQYEAQLAVADEIERKQNAINSKIQTDYNRDTRILAERLRDTGLQEASCTVPASAESAAGTGAAAEDATVIKLADVFADTLQCSKLIEWAKSVSGVAGIAGQ